jgi:hypothetical protein
MRVVGWSWEFPKETPGQTLARVLSELSGPARVYLVQEAERQAKATGDLEMLRAVREYQAEARKISLKT